MSRPSTIRKPRADQLRAIHRLLETPLQPWQRRRAEVLVLHAGGVSAADSARLLDAHVHTIHADLHAFARRGLDAIRTPRLVGAPAHLSDAQLRTIWRLAETPPFDLGLPYGRWSLAKLRAYLIGQRVLRTISREHLRRVLKKGASPCAGYNANWSAPTPAARRSWAASAPAGGTGPAAACCCSSTSSR
jgi:transposase